MMSGPQLAQLRKDAGLFTNSLEESDDTDTDWQDLFFRTGIQTSHDIGVSGGTQGGSYSFGAGYYHDEAVIPTQQFDRYSVRGNFDQKVGEYFRFGLTTNNGFRINKGNQIGVYNALSMSPLASPYDENGNLKRIGYGHNRCQAYLCGAGFDITHVGWRNSNNFRKGFLR